MADGKFKDTQINIADTYLCDPLPFYRIPAEKFRNGIVVRMPNWLGDAVMALPALWQLSKIKPPQCALFVIIPENLRQLFASLDFIDGIITLKNLHRSWSWQEQNILRRFRMGVGILFNNSLRDAVMMKLSGVPLLFGAKARGRSFLLRRSYAFPKNIAGKLAKLHHANKYLAIVYALGAPQWNGELPPVNIKTPPDEMSETVRSLCRHAKMLVLGCGAAYGAAKRWESSSFRQVAETHINNGGIVCAVGGKSERTICSEVLSGLPENKAFNLAGMTNMEELMQLLRAAVFVVANDSGVMHLASLLGTPGAAIFGSTDYTATCPIGANWHLLCTERSCAPCFKRVCPIGSRACMKDIPPEAVAAYLPH